MKETTNKSLEDEVYVIGLWFLGIGSIAFVLYYFVIVPLLPTNACVFWELLGLYCPGCGGTRAVTALLHGRLLQSLWYHPVVVYSVVMFGGFMITNTLKKFRIGNIKGWKFHDWYLYLALIIIVANCVLKNALLMAFDVTL